MLNARLFRAHLAKEQFAQRAWSFHSDKAMREFIVGWRRLLNWTRLPRSSSSGRC